MKAPICQNDVPVKMTWGKRIYWSMKISEMVKEGCGSMKKVESMMKRKCEGRGKCPNIARLGGVVCCEKRKSKLVFTLQSV